MNDVHINRRESMDYAREQRSKGIGIQCEHAPTHWEFWKLNGVELCSANSRGSDIRFHVRRDNNLGDAILSRREALAIAWILINATKTAGTPSTAYDLQVILDQISSEAERQ